MLKPKLTAAEHAALADGLKTAYVADGTEFRLDVVEDPRIKELQTTVGEFRETNITVLKELAAIKKARDGDPDLPIRKTGDQLKIAKLEEEMLKLTAENTKANSVASAATFKNDVAQIATGAGVRDTAIADVVARSQAAGWKAEEGGITSYGADGKAVMSTSDPSQRMTLSEWVKNLRHDGGAHLFKDSSGVGNPNKKPSAPEALIENGVLKNPSVEDMIKHGEAIKSGALKVDIAKSEGYASV